MLNTLKIYMPFSSKHKAMLITFLISGTVVLALFNLHIKKQNIQISESYYEIEPEKELTEKELQALEKQAQEQASKAETNKAFNETRKSNRFAQAYKTIEPPKDYVKPDLSNNNEALLPMEDGKKQEETSKINEDKLDSFSKVNAVLKQQREEGNNAKSTMSYSLVNRKHRYLPTPIYLCEESGKIVVNITVNALGKVVDAYFNKSSSSLNECLIEHALEYAKKARFNADATKDSQIGSITFYFRGKN